jgi:hypothetical protein
MKVEDVLGVLIVSAAIAAGVILFMRFIVPLFGPLFDFVVRGGR